MSEAGIVTPVLGCKKGERDIMTRSDNYSPSVVRAGLDS